MKQVPAMIKMAAGRQTGFMMNLSLPALLSMNIRLELSAMTKACHDEQRDMQHDGCRKETNNLLERI